MTNPLLLAGLAAATIVAWVCRVDLAAWLGHQHSRVEQIHVNPEAAALLESGKAFLGRGDYDGAIGEFTEALNIDPNYAAAYGDRGDAYVDKAEYTLAIADYDEAIRLYPTEAIVYFGRAVAYYNLGEYRRAIADYDESIKLDPKYRLAFSYRGVAYMNRNKTGAPSPIPLALSGPVQMAHMPAFAQQSPATGRPNTNEAGGQSWSVRNDPWAARNDPWAGRSGGFSSTPWHSAPWHSTPAASPARTRTTAVAPPPARQSGWVRK